MFIFKAILFSKRHERKIKAFVPIYNKYIIGKLCDKPKLGLATGIFNFLNVALFIAYIILSYFLVLDYSVYGELYAASSRIYLSVPDNLIIVYNITRYGWLASASLTFILWAYLMRCFSIKNNKSSWWMFVWAICPIVGYIYFATLRQYYIPKIGIVELKEISV